MNRMSLPRIYGSKLPSAQERILLCLYHDFVALSKSFPFLLTFTLNLFLAVARGQGSKRKNHRAFSSDPRTLELWTPSSKTHIFPQARDKP